METPDGKWGDNLGNVFFIDSNHLIASVVESIERVVSTLVLPVGEFGNLQQLFDDIKGTTIDHYAMTSNVIFDHRVDIYTGSSSDR